MTLPGLIPETDLERSLLADRAVLDGLAWGAPRDGHPEGTVAHHVESMLARIARDDPDREALRVLALVHDARKYLVVRAGDAVGRLLRDGEVVRQALREHPPLREAEAVDARLFRLSGPRGSHLWEPR